MYKIQVLIMRRTLPALFMALVGLVLGWLWLNERTPKPVLQDDTPVVPPPNKTKPMPKQEPLADILASAQNDSLTSINGIGAVFEQALNDIGIFTYEQLAQQDPKTLAETLPTRITEDRILRDMWIEQAKTLSNQG